MFFLYLYPFDFSTNPRTVDVIGIGVNRKNNHIFSVNSPFAFDTAPTKVNAPNIDNSEATNNIIDVFLHLSGILLSIVFEGFLYIYEKNTEFSYKSLLLKINDCPPNWRNNHFPNRCICSMSL